MAEPTKVVYDEAYVSSSLDARVQYLTDFIEFTSDDADALRDAAPLLTPVIPGLIDAVYVKLFHYPVTKAVFVERYGVVDPGTGKKALSLESTDMKGRKDFLTRWVKMIITGDYASGAVRTYMQRVGRIHNGIPVEKKRALFVPLRDSALLLGWLEGQLVSTILPLPEETLAAEEKVRLVGALNKIVWIQMELMSHAQVSDLLEPDPGSLLCNPLRLFSHDSSSSSGAGAGSTHARAGRMLAANKTRALAFFLAMAGLLTLVAGIWVF